MNASAAEVEQITKAHTPEAERWKGWGTSLKPAVEPVIVARKPLSEKTVAANTLTWGTGGLNIDKTRIGPQPAGRWPANVVLDPDTAKALDQQSGTNTGAHGRREMTRNADDCQGVTNFVHDGVAIAKDSGGASRFFKVVEPDTAFREDLKSRAPRRSESNFDVATGRPLGPATLMEDHIVEPDPPFMYAAKAPKKERPTVKRTVLRLRDDLTPEQVDHVQARLREVGVKPL